MLLRKKEEIETWLNQYNVENYTLIKDEEYGYVVNIKGDVDLCNKKLKNINIKFNEVQGSFDCRHNKLTLLEGCPDIVNGSFNCSFNKLNSLKYSPKIVNDNFSCSFNKLTTLEGCPNIVSGHFNCFNNELKTLEGCPEIINGNFNCNSNKLISLKGIGKILEGDLDCSNNLLKIEELIYLQEQGISNYIDVSNNKKLGELQDIRGFKELKEKVEEIFNIQKEKENLLEIIKKEDLNKNKSSNKI